jgi:hypothetical protein
MGGSSCLHMSNTLWGHRPGPTRREHQVTLHRDRSTIVPISRIDIAERVVPKAHLALQHELGTDPVGLLLDHLIAPLREDREGPRPGSRWRDWPA